VTGGPQDRRDFAGHRRGAPDVTWPGGARVAVSVVVNVEEGAELSLGDGDERNEGVYEAVEPVEGAVDPCMESHFEYGPRAGWPRIRATLRERGVPATLNACGRALERTPWIAEEAVADGHEVAAHGWRWERHVHMGEAQERRAIARTVEAVARTAGAPPLGWHTRSATSTRTRDLLIEQGGFLYDSNAYNDDLPYAVETAAGPHVVLPYAFDTNDMRFHNRGGFVFGDDFARYCGDALDRLLGEDAPRMLSVGLHTRIIGRPARVGGLAAFLDRALDAGGVWFATRAEIARHWREATGLPEWRPRPCPEGFADAAS
jgi:peptidoglycan/xylan/chitin deacetylase (PgdA/CDA1 family)